MAPFIDPCTKNGHRTTVVDGWVVCTVCGRTLWRAGPDPKKPGK